MPVVQSAVQFRKIEFLGTARPGVFKYRLLLEDGKLWLLYMISENGSDPQIQHVSSTQLQGKRGWSGLMQVCKNPSATVGESVFDAAAGDFATDAIVRAFSDGATGTYTLEWNKFSAVPGQRLLMFALPHHVQSFEGSTAQGVVDVRLQTTTKGVANAVLGDIWTMRERDLPMDMDFRPWHPSARSRSYISENTAYLIRQVAQAEMAQDLNGQTNLDSMYFSGKALSKFAVLVYTLHDLLQDKGCALEGLARLKQAFARFVNNHQIFPLVYDTVWHGLVSSGAYATGDRMQDFGNSIYNDHHFHYGGLDAQISGFFLTICRLFYPYSRDHWVS